MQLCDTASALALEEGPDDDFVYYGREGEIISVGATHVRIKSSVRAIEDNAFGGRWKMRIMILNDGLEEIGLEAFSECTSLERIIYPTPSRGLSGWYSKDARG